MTSPKHRRRPASPAAPARTRPAPVGVNGRNGAIALGELSANLGYRIRRAQLWVFKDAGRRLAPFALSPAQFSVLAIIDANPGINQLSIAAALDIERAGLGRLVDRLEHQGMVTRTASGTHSRYYTLHLTAAARTLLARVKPVIAESEKALADKVGSHAYRSLLKSLSVFLHDPGD